ncbi:DMT family transporter [Candidatus Formimonas warabiya]|nr:DMT family transporter [Candidatus Formimonas warabiya]
MRRLLPYLSATGMALIFGFSFLFTKNALETLDTFQLLFLRFLMAFIVMSLLVLFKIIKINFQGKNLKPLLLVAILQPVIYFIMETFGLKHATSSEAGVMMAFIPVIVAVVGMIILKEKITQKQALSIVLSFMGVIILVVMSGKEETGGEFKGIMFLLGAVATAAFYNIYSRKASFQFTPYEITYFMMLCGTVFFGLAAAVAGLINGNISNLFVVDSTAFASLLYLGLLSSVGAFFMVNYTLSKIPASQSAIFSNLISVVSVFAGVMFRHEAFELYKMFGAVLIIAGVFGTNYFGSKDSEKCLEESFS